MGVVEALQRRRVLAHTREPIECRPSAETHRAHVVGQRLRPVQRRHAGIRVDIGDRRLSNLTVEDVIEVDGIPRPVTAVDDPVEFVLDEGSAFVDDDRETLSGRVCSSFRRRESGVSSSKDGDALRPVGTGR